MYLTSAILISINSWHRCKNVFTSNAQSDCKFPSCSHASTAQLHFFLAGCDLSLSKSINCSQQAWDSRQCYGTSRQESTTCAHHNYHNIWSWMSKECEKREAAPQDHYFTGHPFTVQAPNSCKCNWRTPVTQLQASKYIQDHTNHMWLLTFSVRIHHPSSTCSCSRCTTPVAQRHSSKTAHLTKNLH